MCSIQLMIYCIISTKINRKHNESNVLQADETTSNRDLGSEMALFV